MQDERSIIQKPLVNYSGCSTTWSILRLRPASHTGRHQLLRVFYLLIFLLERHKEGWVFAYTHFSLTNYILSVSK